MTAELRNRLDEARRQEGGTVPTSHFALPMPEWSDNRRGTRRFRGWAGGAQAAAGTGQKSGKSFRFGGILAHFALTQALQQL